MSDLLNLIWLFLKKDVHALGSPGSNNTVEYLKEN